MTWKKPEAPFRAAGNFEGWYGDPEHLPYFPPKRSMKTNSTSVKKYKPVGCKCLL